MSKYLLRPSITKGKLLGIGLDVRNNPRWFTALLSVPFEIRDLQIRKWRGGLSASGAVLSDHPDLPKWRIPVPYLKEVL